APSPGRLGALAFLLGAGILVEAFPVPIDRLSPGGKLSLGAFVVVGTAVLHGWAAAALVACGARAALEIVQIRGAARLAFNGAVYALAGAASGAMASLVTGGSSAETFGSVALGTAGFYL